MSQQHSMRCKLAQNCGLYHNNNDMLCYSYFSYVLPTRKTRYCNKKQFIKHGRSEKQCRLFIVKSLSLENVCLRGWYQLGRPNVKILKEKPIAYYISNNHPMNPSNGNFICFIVQDGLQDATKFLRLDPYLQSTALGIFSSQTNTHSIDRRQR